MISILNPYQTIWLNPRRTFADYVVNSESQSLFALPIIIIGLSLGLNMTTEINAILDDEFVWWSLLIAIPMGIVTAFLILGFIMPGLIKLVGRIWNGESTMRQMVNVYSISSIPYGLILIYQIALFAIGEDPLIDRVNAGFSYMQWLWSFTLLIIGISQIQRFSYGMALLNILIRYLPILMIGILRAT
ncbi:MAG: hypothetical protein ACI93L_003461 [Cyclobacteriaceae bacterium]|jgi:hypothetical protein